MNCFLKLSKDNHMIEIVFGIVQEQPYDTFQKITHTPIPQNFSLLEFEHKMRPFNHVLNYQTYN